MAEVVADMAYRSVSGGLERESGLEVDDDGDGPKWRQDHNHNWHKD